MPGKSRKNSDEASGSEIAAQSTEVVLKSNAAISMSKRQDSVTALANLSQLQNYFGSEVLSWQEIEPSFPVIQKSALVDTPFVIAGIRMNESTKFMTPDEVNPDVLNPGRFLSILVAQYDENSGDFIGPWSIVNDGSTGVMKSLVNFVKREVGDDADVSAVRFNEYAARVPAITCSRGLRASEYQKEIEVDGKKKVIEATTYYIQ